MVDKSVFNEGAAVRAAPPVTISTYRLVGEDSSVQFGDYTNKSRKFSAAEDQLLKSAIATYRLREGLSLEQMTSMIFQKNKKRKDNTFWSEIAAVLPHRSFNSVYTRVRRVEHPMKQQGLWMEVEDIQLMSAVHELGQSWEKVSLRVGRAASDCKDRYRYHLAHREKRITGKWTPDEEEKLITIVTRMYGRPGQDVRNENFWGQVSQEMGFTRGTKQCRDKWNQSLSKSIKNGGRTPRWTAGDSYILIHKVDSLGVQDETEVVWNTLLDPTWNWTGRDLRCRWNALKSTVAGWENKVHSEIVSILRVRHIMQSPKEPPAMTILHYGSPTGSDIGHRAYTYQMHEG